MGDSDRQWGTVREDYTYNGDVWNSLRYEDAMCRAYRWGEDGIGGLSDNHGRVNLAFAFWNENDPFLKERFFGLTGPEANHGEDVKELYYYEDSTPTHSYMKMLYKYPQARFPYEQLRERNNLSNRSRQEQEYELLDTGIFDKDEYFDIVVEYCKADVDDVLCRVTIFNRSEHDAPIHVLPTVWYRNTWSWEAHNSPGTETPVIRLQPQSTIDYSSACLEDTSRNFQQYCHFAAAPDGVLPTMLFTGNETNFERLYGQPNKSPFVKDAFNRYVVHGEQSAVDPSNTGTKCAALYKLLVPGHGQAVIKLRFTPAAGVGSMGLIGEFPETGNFFADDVFEAMFKLRKKEADEFYANFQPHSLSEDLKNIQRQAWAGMLWSKQFYFYAVQRWMTGDPGQPVPPPDRKKPWARWLKVVPWHCGGNSTSFSPGQKLSLEASTRRRRSINARQMGVSLIAVAQALPVNGRLRQADATGWMAFFALYMLNIALELAQQNPVYEDIASKFFEHFLYISDALSFSSGENGHMNSLWDPTDGFYYDNLQYNDGRVVPLRVRSMVGLIPLFAAVVLEPEMVEKLPGFQRRMNWFLDNWDFTARNVSFQSTASGELSTGHRDKNYYRHRILLSLFSKDRLESVLQKLLDPEEFLSERGIRSLSKYHKDHPYTWWTEWGEAKTVAYLPGESDSGLFGGNSNWRGPVWLATSFLIIEALQRFHYFYGDDGFSVECPAGSGTRKNLNQIADDIMHRTIRLFSQDLDGRRPYQGTGPRSDKLNFDPHFKDHLLFYEYFDGDTGRGLGASHQTGWTGLVAKMILSAGLTCEISGRCMIEMRPPEVQRRLAEQRKKRQEESERIANGRVHHN
ncbi:hypothetical protein HDU93_000994 [Gonapodya sp. JEL0774]|nr:hypothetical protein HDU93_000994 [Gonapodya sp. JEL0774]